MTPNRQKFVNICWRPGPTSADPDERSIHPACRWPNVGPLRQGGGVDELALRESAEQRLRALAGDQARLRDDQWTAIEALVSGRRRALVVQRTGWGKSAVYFVATALLRELGEGPTI